MQFEGVMQVQYTVPWGPMQQSLMCDILDCIADSESDYTMQVSADRDKY
jgi:hypothetical protein